MKRSIIHLRTTLAIRSASQRPPPERPQRTSRPGTRRLVDTLVRLRCHYDTPLVDAPHRAGAAQRTAAMSGGVKSGLSVRAPTSRAGSYGGNLEPLAVSDRHTVLHKSAEHVRTRHVLRRPRRAAIVERAATRGRGVTEGGGERYPFERQLSWFRRAPTTVSRFSCPQFPCAICDGGAEPTHHC